jgi:predicted nucleic acid-binding protein
VYFASDDPARSGRAEALLRAGGVVSVQILNELTLACRRKLRMPWNDIDKVLRAVRATCQVVPLTEKSHDLGRQLAEHYQLPVYDAMIVASALLADCDTVYSEDLHDGLVIENRLTVHNPFKPH